MDRTALIVLPALLVAALAVPACGDQWDSASHPETTFPLEGLHIPLACAECHPAGEPLDAAPTACEGCHEPDRPEPHDPQGCGECHTALGWDDGVAVDHDFFPLDFAHDRPCLDCHVEGTYEGLDPTCSSCHEADRPDTHHDGQDCGDCHTPTVWDDAIEDHDFFPLEDAHALPCEACHAPGTDKDDASPVCTSCHADEEPEPGHRLSEGCDGCHVPTLWTDVFAHDPIFPIPHRDANQCVECHVTDTRDDFSCVDGCHSKGETDGEHREEGGYEWASWACYDCHPNGKGD
jgi:hypothetical protein